MDLVYDTGYIAWETQCAFDAWQASLESLVIELPKPYSEHRMVSKPERYARSSTLCVVLEAIEAAGLKVKP